MRILWSELARTFLRLFFFLPSPHFRSRGSHVRLTDLSSSGGDVAALLVSSHGHHVDVGTPLAPRGGPVSPPALHLACHCGDLAAVSALLDAHVARLDLEAGPRSWLPISHAVAMGHLAVVKLLVARGSPLPGDEVLVRAIDGGQLTMLSWLLSPTGGALDINEHPKALRRAVKSDVAHTLSTIVSVCKLTAASLSSALEWAVETGSVLRVNRLLEAGADPALGHAVHVATAANSTPLVHRLLDAMHGPQSFPGTVAVAAAHANPELVRELLAHGAHADAEAYAAATCGGTRSDAATLRTCAVLLTHSVDVGTHGNAVVDAARAAVAAEVAAAPNTAPLRPARLVGREKAFVHDKPVPHPQSFSVSIAPRVLIGRADPADASHRPDVDMTAVAAAASVSRSHVAVRWHGGLGRWEFLVLGRNGVYDLDCHFFPPNADTWIPVDALGGGGFEVGWTVFEVVPE